MIRFVDLRTAEIEGTRFAFFDTVHARFMDINGDQTWETWTDFQSSLNLPQFSYKTEFIERLKSLCPGWVFEEKTP